MLKIGEGASFYGFFLEDFARLQCPATVSDPFAVPLKNPTLTPFLYRIDELCMVAYHERRFGGCVPS